MNNKQKIIIIIIVMGILLGLFTRIDVIFLADKYRSTSFDNWVKKESKIHNDSYYISVYKKYDEKYNKEGFKICNSEIKNNIIFGYKFYNFNPLKEKIYWLSEEENLQLHNLLCNSYFDSIPQLYNGNQPLKKYDGCFFALPSWTKFCGIKKILTPFTSRIYMLYYPEKNHLYLSDTKIDSEFCFGIHITNVPPSLVYLDNKAIEEAIRK